MSRCRWKQAPTSEYHVPRPAAVACGQERKKSLEPPHSRSLYVVRLTLNQTKMGPGKKLVRRNYSIFFTALRAPGKKAVFSWSLSTSWKTKAHITWFSQHRNAASQWGGGEGLRLQSQEGQDLCAAAAAGHLMFKTSTEDQTVDLTNKGMTKDSERFSPWFHSAWRTTGPIL